MKSAVIVIIIAICIISAAIGPIWYLNHQKKNDPCIVNCSLRPVCGWITTVFNNGLISSGGGDTAYWLQHKGVRKESGEICYESFRVTESRYNQMMYGGK
jgi:hypothetical protein